MKSSRNKITALLLCITLLLFPKPAKADIGPSSGEVAAIIVGFAAAGAAIGIGIYYAVAHKNSSLTGCASLNSDNLTLLNEGDQQTYKLTGDIANIKSGERVHVSGKKQKDPSGKHTFLVDKLSKDYGPCKVAP